MRTILNSKGQITIPKRIRDILRLLPGDAVEFSVKARGEVLLRRLRQPLAEPLNNDRFEAVRGCANVNWRKEELMNFLRPDD